MSYSRKNRSILLTLALLLAISLVSGALIWPEQGDASSQNNESSTLVTSIKTQAESSPIYYTDRVAVLTYHNLGAQETTATISPTHFREQIQGLQQLGYNFISLQQLSDFLAGQKPIPPNAVVLTFDDGYASVYRYAFPILQAENIPAAVFLIVKHVGADKNEIPKLTWSQIAEMKVWGIDFESHSYDSHVVVRTKDGRNGPSLTSRGYLPEVKREENVVEYQDRIMYDLYISKSILENHLGSEVRFLALPFGSQNQIVRQTTQLAGYDFAFTVEPGLISAGSDPLALNRFNAGTGGLDAKNLHKLIRKYCTASKGQAPH